MRPVRPKRSSARTRFDVPASYGGSRRDRPPPWLSSRAMLALAGVLIALGLGVMGARWLMSERFHIREVRVVNNQAISAAQVQQAAALTGQHVLLVNLSATALQNAAERVKDIPGIDRAKVACSVEAPVTCIVTVQPSPPLAVFKSAQASMWMDSDGRVQRGGPDSPDAFVLTVSEAASMPVFGAVVSRRLVRAVDELVFLHPQASEAQYSTEFGITLVMERGLKVRIGVSERDGSIGEKLALMSKIRSQLAARGRAARIIDVRFIDAPFYVE